MDIIKCIALDDEPMALEVVKGLIKKVPFLSLEESFRSPVRAIDFLNKEEIDLLFLDINMPDLSGIQLIRSVSKLPLVILTTAYSQYAVESYELDVVDYLLKPISFDRFIMAVDKARKIHQSMEAVPGSVAPMDLEQASYAFVKSGQELVKLEFDKVTHVEGTGNYLTFHSNAKPVLTIMTMNKALELLPEGFIRIHKSFIVAVNKIERVENHQLWIGDKAIPIGGTYRTALMEILRVGRAT